ncbi:MAG: hypothetical protein DRH15_12375, partial [Deltaproteobacteria bacterium]
MQGPLRVDWLEEIYTASGKLGITILPGRKDFSRSLENDIKSLKADGITHIISLLTTNEIEIYGVANLFKSYEEAGFT